MATPQLLGLLSGHPTVQYVQHMLDRLVLKPTFELESNHLPLHAQVLLLQHGHQGDV